MTNRSSTRIRAALTTLSVAFAVLGAAVFARDLSQPNAADFTTGPYNVRILEGGEGLTRKLNANLPALAANAPWSMTGWVCPQREHPGKRVILAVGDEQGLGRLLLLVDNKPAAWTGSKLIAGSEAIPAGAWSALAVTFDGKRARIYVNGREVGADDAESVVAAPNIHVAPSTNKEGVARFGGLLAGLEFRNGALDAKTVLALARARPDFNVIVFHEVGGHWPWQVKQWRGLQEPQDPWTLPKGNAPFSKPVAKPVPDQKELAPRGASLWTLDRWRLAAAPTVSATPAQISATNYSDADWYAATVPGTVLTTLIDRGVYPDYDYGLDNMAIPESLARQDYWYRTSFEVPEKLRGQQLTLTFKGINYAAEVWINGARLGAIKGAFIRGTFDVTSRVSYGARNALAVRVSPPPHPGIPHEESIAAGPGENGGWVALDGPTFAASEGWDWIPGIRDRNTGIWQEVVLAATGRVRLLDPQVISRLPLPRTDSAELSLLVPVDSSHIAPVAVTVTAKFDGVSVSQTVSVNPGRTDIRFEPSDFPQLKLGNPRLWWPNGYGAANLYTLELSAFDRGAASDTKSVRFGIRHVTYELSLFDSSGRLRRVEVDVAGGTARGERLVDITHEAIKKSPGGWAASLTKAGETSPAIKELPPSGVSPHLTLHVNGIPIIVRGGNWGMDDSRKRIERSRLEPYFRLQKDANLNVMRNWMGNNNEDVFFDLADEYGLMVFNDFWASTQDFQVEPQDPQLFLANAEDTVTRYRNHPSIVLWFGRNEGVPQPILNEGLADLIARLDGTRHFTGSSNVVNLQGSGPYNYRPPVGYFTTLASGFSVETGTPSLATLEAIEAMVPAADRWPLSDTLAYHDWHFGGNGDVKTFMETLKARYGEGKSLADFEAKSQLMNYETYRAVFEGLQAHLWTKNSGRFLWMTHPAWPSNHWQIYSSDYDTHAAYYGVKKAVEPMHAQMNLPDYSLTVVNSTLTPRTGLKLSSKVFALDNTLLASRDDALAAAANDVTHLAPLALADLLETRGLVLVRLELTDADGRLVSRNTYLQGKNDASHQKLNELAAPRLDIKAISLAGTDPETVTQVTVHNTGKVPALGVKLTLANAAGARILPALYDDNYLTLLPGEERVVEIRHAAAKGSQVAVRGWNLATKSYRVRAARVTTYTGTPYTPGITPRSKTAIAATPKVGQR
jgi:hypothetical protein